ncbi:hypothetical protein GGR53DRAFT_465870 [Hypoxylon sp. FL1150]|nr:hypothetical protein GGR53DRAFT_465870 [Hypoxylon sp. FL1150]
MGKDSVKSSGAASRKANKSQREESKKKSSSDTYSIDNYQADTQYYDQFVTSGSSNRNAAQYLQNWDKTWDAATGRKD